jgi:hypothetical protein
MLRAIALGLWLGAAAAGAGEAAEPSTAVPPEPAPPSKPKVYVVSHLKAPLRFGNEQIGELPEGTRVTVVREAGSWLQIRAQFGAAWVTGWVSTALVEPDSLAKMTVEVGKPALEYSYERRSLPGYQFLILRVRFTPAEGAPSRLYFQWGDADTADVALTYNRDKTALPYGFLQRQDMTDRREFQTEVKRQVVDLTTGQPVVETYVFAVPARARGFVLTLKDVRRPVRMGR